MISLEDTALPDNTDFSGGRLIIIGEEERREYFDDAYDFDKKRTLLESLCGLVKKAACRK